MLSLWGDGFFLQGYAIALGGLLIHSFIEWRLVRRFCFGLLMVTVAVWFGLVKAKPRPVRVAARILSVPVGALGALWALLTWGVSGCQTYSHPIFAPSGRLAARIWTDDEGAAGGHTSVELFSAHGFNTNRVYWGSWKSVLPEDVHWASPSELTISYKGKIYFRTDAQAIQVRCLAKQ